MCTEEQPVMALQGSHLPSSSLSYVCEHLRLCKSVCVIELESNVPSIKIETRLTPFIKDIFSLCTSKTSLVCHSGYIKQK